MIRVLLQRLAIAVPVLLGVSILVFALMEWIPGDPALAILGPMATEENLQNLREELNLNEPLVVRYGTWMQGILQGDWGTSYSMERPVWEEVRERFSATLILAGVAFILCILLGVLAGVAMAVRQNSLLEKVIMVAVTAGISTPAFWLGLVLIQIFAIHLGWLPTGGMGPAMGEVGWMELLPYLVLPALTLSLVAASIIARILRARMIELLRMDFIRTARAKGLPERTIIWRHAFRNALPPLLPLLGIQAGYVLGGAVYVESIFQWPGIGSMLVAAIQSRDLLLVQGGVLIVATTYVLLNLLADILQHALDPRTLS
ncbi:MAG: ABC transporter permease [Opitutales bacterium]|nr:ABC transporter permease [Opitutales bacterium]